MIYQVMRCTKLVNYNNFWDQVSKTNEEPSYNASIIISSMYGTVIRKCSCNNLINDIFHFYVHLYKVIIDK